MTEHQHPCANCSNNGMCSELRGPAILALYPRSKAVPPAVRASTTTALAPRFARAYAAECRRPSIDGELLLRDTTAALVSRLKADGLPPERVLVALKAAIARHADGVEPPSLIVDDMSASSRSVYRRVLQWALGSYFDQPI